MEEKLKILMVHNYYQIPGGEDTVVANEKRMLEDQGHRVILYQRSNLELKNMSKIRKMFLPVTMVFSPKVYKEVCKIIKEQKTDLVHVHNTLFLISPSVYYAAIKRGVPVVQTIHNFRLLCPGATFYRAGHICEECVKKGLIRAIKHKCYRDSRLQTLACGINMKIHRLSGIYRRINYICLTEFNRNKLLEFNQIRKENVFIKSNFVESAGAVMPGEQRKNQFVFAGRLEKIKGVDLLLAAWKEMADQAPGLIICGTGPLEGWCGKFVEEKNLKTVQMMGYVPNEKVQKLIGESKALILPTRCYEGFPMSMVEAFSVGTPVVCPDMGNTGSIVLNGINGLKFIPDSKEDLIRAVLEISKYNQINETTYHTYLEKYTRKKNYRKMMDIYKEVIRRG